MSLSLSHELQKSVKVIRVKGFTSTNYISEVFFCILTIVSGMQNVAH